MLRSILILGGTNEALQLAERLDGIENLRVITSLAGRVKNPRTPKGELRHGGFGGIDGLAEYLKKETIDQLIDATHPFAEQISQNAFAACELSRTKHMQLLRPKWEPEEDDLWISVPDLVTAAETLPKGVIAFLALGSQHLAAFSKPNDVRFIARMIELPNPKPAISNLEILIGKPSSDLEKEIALLRHHKISHLVCRNSGGTGAWQKLLAARKLKLPVIMIERPAAPTGPTFSNIETLFSSIPFS